MQVDFVINGLGHMGGPGIHAATCTMETLRNRSIDLQIAGLIDVDATLQGALAHLTRGLSPTPRIVWQDLRAVKSIDAVLAQDLALLGSNRNVVVYDASPTNFHYQNAMACAGLRNVTYLSEKPLFSTPEEMHLFTQMMETSEGQAVSASDRVFCDLIETQNSACLHLIDMVKTGELKIGSMQFWRLNSSGIAKAFHPARRHGVQGGALIDKSIHDLAVTAALLAGYNASSLKARVRTASPLCFLPAKSGTERCLLSGTNNAWNEYQDNTDWPADGACTYHMVWEIDSREIPVTYYASWIGFSKFEELAREANLTRLRDTIRSTKLPLWLHQERHDGGFWDEDVRFLHIEGQLNGKPTVLFANFLARGTGIVPWIWNATDDVLIPMSHRPYGANQLARVLELVVMSAAAQHHLSSLSYIPTVLCHKYMFEAHRLLKLAVGPVEEEFIKAHRVVGNVISLSEG